MPTYGKGFSCLWAIPYCMTFPFSEYCAASILKYSFQLTILNNDTPFYLVCSIIIIRNITYVNIIYVILRTTRFLLLNVPSCILCLWPQI